MQGCLPHYLLASPPQHTGIAYLKEEAEVEEEEEEEWGAGRGGSCMASSNGIITQ